MVHGQINNQMNGNSVKNCDKYDSSRGKNIEKIEERHFFQVVRGNYGKISPNLESSG